MREWWNIQQSWSRFIAWQTYVKDIYTRDAIMIFGEVPVSKAIFKGKPDDKGEVSVL